MVKGDKGLGNKGKGKGEQGKSGKGKAKKHPKNCDTGKGKAAPTPVVPEPAIPLTDEQKKQAELDKKMQARRPKRKWNCDGGNLSAA